MASLKRNIVANIVGKVWSAGIVILLIPQYIKYLGIESYGLIGFYATLIGSMLILDLGLSTTLNRELAKFRAGNQSPADIRDLTFSLECIYWCVGLLISLSVVALSGFIAAHWVNAEKLSFPVVKQSVILMGIVMAFQWPISLYNGGLTGLEKQVLNNLIIVIMSTIRAVGVLAVLHFVSPTIQVFFIWQAVTSLLYVLIMRWGLWKELPRHHLKPRFSKDQVKVIWRFAAGMTGISIVTFFLSQADKIVLSKILPLSQFGYYSLAFSVSSSITLLTAPIIVAFFPRFAALSSRVLHDELIFTYHQACRLMAFFMFPFGFFLLFFMKNILLIWTRDMNTTENSFLLAQILIAGNMLNALMIVPYNLIIAGGWTKFAFIQNAIASIIIVPLLFWLTNMYGATGAACVWVLINAGYVLISQPIIHRRLLKTELVTWYWNDTLLPMLPSLMAFLIIKFSLKYFLPDLRLSFAALCCIFVIGFTLSIINMPVARTIFLRKLFQRKIST